MATPTISTKFAIEGEKEYKSAVSSINSELKKLQSELDVVDSQYQTSQNTLEALTKKNEALTNVQEAQAKKLETLKEALSNAQQAQNTWAEKVESAQAKLTAASTALDNYKKSGENDQKQLEELTKAQEAAQKELDTAKAGYDAATKGADNWATQVNRAQISLNNTDAELEKNKQYMDEAKKSTDKCASSIDEFGNKVEKGQSALEEFAESQALQTIADKTKELVDQLADCVESYMELDQAMAGVSRTTGMTGDDLEALKDDFEEMSTTMPITAEELASIATTAGQLGIANENIESFTTVMAKLATATDLTADDAATMLAQFANVSQMDPSNYDRLGATLASLGDSTATTASRITELSEGIAASATVAGMNQAEIVGISAAFGSVGVQASRAATALNALIANIDSAVKAGGDDLETFAESAGMSAGQFKAAWETDAAGALATLVTNLGEADDAYAVMDSWGITATKQQQVLMSVASAGDLLTTSIEQANQAWEENTALDEKASTMYDTLSAKYTMLQNSVTQMKNSIGEALAPAVEDLIENGATLIEGVTNFVEEHPKLTAALGEVATVLAAILTTFLGINAAKKLFDASGIAGAVEKLGSDLASAVGLLGGTGLAAGLAGLAGVTAAITALVIAINGTTTGALYNSGTITLSEAAANGNGTVSGTKLESDVSLDQLRENAEYQQQRADNWASRSVDEWTAGGGDAATFFQMQSDAAEDAARAWDEYNEAAEAAGVANTELGNAVSDTDTELEAQSGAYTDLSLQLDELVQKYQDAYNAAYESINGQYQLWDSINEEDLPTYTAQEITDNLNQQTEYWNNYNTNLETLQQRAQESDGALDGLSEMIASFADGSEDSVAAIDAMAGASDEDLAAMVTAWEENQTAVDDAAKGVADASVDIQGEMDTLASELETKIGSMDYSSEAYSSGITTMQGFVDAVNEQGAQALLDAQSWASQVASALTTDTSGSESGTTDSGEHQYASGTSSAVRGMALVGEHGPELVYMNGGESVLDAARTAELASQVVTASAGRKNANTNAGLESLLKSYLPQIAGNMQKNIVLDTGALVGQTASAMNSALGSIGRQRARGVS